VQYTVHKGVTLTGPTIQTPEHWIVMAFASSLDQALPNCVRTAIDWLNIHGGIDRRDAYALCGMAISFRVTRSPTRPDRCTPPSRLARSTA
jgi:acetamidase/formamidase